MTVMKENSKQIPPKLRILDKHAARQFTHEMTQQSLVCFLCLLTKCTVNNDNDNDSTVNDSTVNTDNDNDSTVNDSTVNDSTASNDNDNDGLRMLYLYENALVPQLGFEYRRLSSARYKVRCLCF